MMLLVESQIRQQLERHTDQDRIAILLKLRPANGRIFDAARYPEAFKIIHSAIMGAKSRGELDRDFRVESDDTGLNVVAFRTKESPSLSSAEIVSEFVASLLSARMTGRGRGDRIASPLELVVRGIGAHERLFNEVALLIKATETAGEQAVLAAVNDILHRHLRP